MPPHLTWVDEFCEEIATLVFFILERASHFSSCSKRKIYDIYYLTFMRWKSPGKQTGYKFRPGCNNPYFKMDDIEAEVLTETAITEKAQKRRVKKGDKVNAYS